MKLVADINSIMTNLTSLASSIEEYSSAVNEFNGASINCSLEEVSGLIEDYKSSISEDLNKLNISSEEYKALVDDCCTEYQANEANVQEIDVSKIDDVIMNNKEVTIDYQGDASSALTGLPSIEIKPTMTPATAFMMADDRAEASEYDVVNEAMAWAIKHADDDKYGYSMNSTRWGEPNFDCSTLVISAYQAAGTGVKDAGASYCGNMKDAFLSTGKFEWIPGEPNVNDLKPGDILLNPNKHTEMYVGKGNNVGAHDNRDGRDGDSSGTEVNVQGYWSPGWTGVLRYKGEKA